MADELNQVINQVRERNDVKSCDVFTSNGKEFYTALIITTDGANHNFTAGSKKEALTLAVKSIGGLKKVEETDKNWRFMPWPKQC